MVGISTKIDTRYWNISPHRPERGKVIQASSIISGGGIVAFPTETVYGLGADAWNSRAIEKIYLAKERPADNPLIVHIAYFHQMRDLVQDITPTARYLARRFWPGPLTLVLPKGNGIPEIVTAGLDTVAIRMPAHPVAKSLIYYSRRPIVAPSANRSGRPSPTTALHVLRDMYGRIDGVMDGGTAKVGVESTVLDITGDIPIILRPGGIPLEDLERALGQVDLDTGLESRGEDTKPRSPGMKYRHYAPKGELHIFLGGPDVVTAKAMVEAAGEWWRKGGRVGILCSREVYEMINEMDDISDAIYFMRSLGGWDDPGAAARGLYSALHQCDLDEVDIILVQALPTRGIALAVMNRLLKAAGNRVVKV